MTTRRTRVLIIDDSAVVRQVLAQVLQRDPAIDVIGAAQDPIFAMERMQRDWPDVIVLDVEMPRMDGITFLKKMMAVRPTPVVICSTLTSKGAETTMQALAAGAVGIVAKPTTGLRDFLQEDGGGIVGAVKAAAAADMRRAKVVAAPSPRPTGEWPSAREPVGTALTRTTDRLVAIGTSTGGTQALEAVLTQLPRVAPGIVIVQHMPEKFTAAFAARLNGLCQIEVAEAKQGDRVVPGRALIAPGGRHMTVRLCGAQYHVDITDGPLVSHHRPSVDVLFRSVAKSAGRNALGVIMTGMGDDGARGMKEMRDAGARTCAQDEKSCVVYGMPREAVRLGGVQQEVPLGGIAAVIDRYGQEAMALSPG